uniref:Uncharacterized protein n=1 Tax=Rhizophora mucronata TaxID=61149 RepID=A0A2P2JSW5_RHIMU
MFVHAQGHSHHREAEPHLVDVGGRHPLLDLLVHGRLAARYQGAAALRGL